MPTKSEELFDTYCSLRGYQSESVEVSQGKTPDRIVVTPIGRIVVEIKELTPNSEDVRQARELQERKWTTGGGTPGARASGLIRKAAPQLKSFSHLEMPSVLVMFNNIVINGMRWASCHTHLESSFIDFAMYGLQTVILAPDSSGMSNNHFSYIGDDRGGRRQMTEDDRVYISAVCVLYESVKDNQPFLCTYHNYFAHIPLSSSVFNGPLDYHYRKPGHPSNSPQAWQKVFPEKHEE